MNKGLIESSENFAGKNTREISEILISAILTSQGVCCCSCIELLVQKENEASCPYLHLSVSFIFFLSLSVNIFSGKLHTETSVMSSALCHQISLWAEVSTTSGDLSAQNTLRIECGNGGTRFSPG